MSAGDPVEIKEPQELFDELVSLSAVDKQRLRMIARYFAAAGGMEPEDLLQEAMMKIHEDVRHCPADVPLLVFMRGVLRSLAN